MKPRYINREISWLQFNQRVLHEALDMERDPISRLIFSAIFSNNLDEFFMVRVGGLIDQIKSNYNIKDIAGMTTKEQLKKIRQRVKDLISLQAMITDKIITTDLKAYGVDILSLSDLTDMQMRYVTKVFNETIYPVVTPMAIDLNRPFPLVLNKSLNILYKFKGEEEKYATIQVPSVLSRVVPIDEKRTGFVLIEDVIMHFSEAFFDSDDIVAKGLYRPTRNADIAPNNEVAEDLLVVIEETIKKRRWGNVVRLEVEADMPKELITYLTRQFDIGSDAVYKVKTYMDLTFLFSLADLRNVEDVLKVSPRPFEHGYDSLFSAIESEDFLLHHPYDSFDTVVDLVDAASKDPDVLAIKQVLYRVSGDSPIVKALARAASAGKQVTVVLELMARFDEANNIGWAKELEKNGCHVIFGLKGMKTHAKITLVVRRVNGFIKRYVHVSSGNYNDKTAKIYTDIGMLTSNEQIAADASKFFNMLSGYTKQSELQEIYAAPDLIKPELLRRIDKEIYWAKHHVDAEIIAKCNAIVDKEIIDKLYEASQAGVKITLIIRGICCLVPGVEGLSENIQVISIVDDFLEHSRIYSFKNNGKDDIFISSADLMPRNLIRRVELMTPVTQQNLKEDLYHILDIYIRSTKKARYLNADGLYITPYHEDDALSAQKALVALYN